MKKITLYISELYYILGEDFYKIDGYIFFTRYTSENFKIKSLAFRVKPYITYVDRALFSETHRIQDNLFNKKRGNKVWRQYFLEFIKTNMKQL